MSDPAASAAVAAAETDLERGWWRPVVPPQLAQEVRWQPLEPGAAEHLLPSGAIELCIDAVGHRRRLERVELAAGANALEWLVERVR